MYCCRILRAGKLPGCAEPWEEAPSMLGSQADLQYKQLETDDPAPRFPRPLSIFFFLSVGTFTSPRVRVAESGRGRDAHVVGPPQYIFSHLRRANPGFSSLLTHYLRDLHLQVEPQLPASAQVLAPCLQDTVQHPAPPPPPAGPQPRPAPAARPLRSGGWRGGRAGSCAVCKAGRSRVGGGAAPKSTNHRCDHIHANTSTMERAHHSLLQASLKRASV